MPTTYIAPNLYRWTVQLENGSTREMASSFLPHGFASPVISAVRGAAVDPAAPPPVITTITPTTAQVGGANFTLQIDGGGFVAGDVILWDGDAEEPTTFVSANRLTTTVNMAKELVARAIPVTVRHVTGVLSNAVTFTVQPAP